MINQISCGNIAIKFKRIHCTVTKTGPCQICGKTSKRTRTFEEHVSFFNCNEDGSQKTADEIKAEIEIKSEDWKNEPIFHQKCLKDSVRKKLDEAGLNYNEESDCFDVYYGIRWTLACKYYFETGSWHFNLTQHTGTIDEFIVMFKEHMAPSQVSLATAKPTVHARFEDYGLKKKVHLEMWVHQMDGESKVELNGIGDTKQDAVNAAMATIPSLMGNIESYEYIEAANSK